MARWNSHRLKKEMLKQNTEQVRVDRILKQRNSADEIVCQQMLDTCYNKEQNRFDST